MMNIIFDCHYYEYAYREDLNSWRTCYVEDFEYLTMKLQTAGKRRKNVTGLSSAIYFQNIKRQVRNCVDEYIKYTKNFFKAGEHE